MTVETIVDVQETPQRKLSEHFRISIVEMLTIAAMWLFLSQHFITIPLFCVAVWINCRSKSGWLSLACWIAVVISMFAPYDIRIADMSSQYRGAPRQHVRVVPYVAGMPMHTRLMANYGEYYSCGCVAVPMAPRGVVSIAIRVPRVGSVPSAPTLQESGEP